MTDQPTTTPTPARTLNEVDAAFLASQKRQHEISSILNSPTTQALMRAVREDGNVTWLEFLREVRAEHLADYLGEDGEPDMDRVRETVDRVFYRTASTTYRGGVTFQRHPKNRPPRG